MSGGDFSGRPSQGSTAPKTFGTLNLVFASVMLLCGVCSGASTLMQVVTAPIAEQAQKRMQEGLAAQQKLDHQKRIDELQAQEDAATNEEDKAQLAAKRQALEQNPPEEVPFADMMNVYREPRLVAFLATEFSTGLLLNIAMFVSGLGLLGYKAWGRQLAVWVAALKIIRLLLVYGFFIFFVVPRIAETMGNTVGKIAEQAQNQQLGPNQPNLPAMDKTLVTVYNVMLTTFAAMMIIFGSIYPIIMLIVLTRPGVKLACGEEVVAADAAGMT